MVYAPKTKSSQIKMKSRLEKVQTGEAFVSHKEKISIESKSGVVADFKESLNSFDDQMMNDDQGILSGI